MRGSFALGLLILPLHCLAQQPSIDVSGVTITLGMLKEQVLAGFPPSLVHCSESGDSEMCLIGDPSGLACHGGAATFAGEGEISFEDQRVWTASRNRRISDSRDAYDMFHQLFDILNELGASEITCAQISTFVNPMLKHIYLVLPEKTVEIGLGSRGDDRSVYFREGIRVNPVAASEKVRKSRSEQHQCIFVAPVP
jgi:hypothetical protein